MKRITGRVTILKYPPAVFRELELHSPGAKLTSRVKPSVFVALGSNLGNSIRIISDAIEELRKLSTDTIAVSSFWQTEPVDCPPGAGNFVNAVVGLIPRVQDSPESLLLRLQAIEKQFGRRPKRLLNEPRPLDLDLIAFGNLTRATKNLTLPHPRTTSRRFVLQPLAEIAPDFVLPGQTKTVVQLLTRLPLDKGIGKIQRTPARRR